MKKSRETRGPDEKYIIKSSKQYIPASSAIQIVGIGASAGGLEALEQFFGSTPTDTGMAFVVIQHLDPNHVGIMPELLQRKTKMKVVQVTDRLKVKPDHVYVIPPNKSMSLLNSHLYLFEPIETRGLRLPVDFFLRSLAEECQEKSIGVILSGMGSDGSLGLKAIKEKHGIVLVQDPATAKFNGMPQSALNAVIADILAPADELPVKLISLLKHMPVTTPKTEIDDKSKTTIEKIAILLRSQTGHDFSMYKKNSLLRRIERRMNVHLIDTMANYIRFLQENPNEINILFKELLIGVTNFFRDTVVWEKLRDKVFPPLLNNLPDGHTMRAWVVGCSTGEEAYSLAITFKEALLKLNNNRNLTLQVFATDIDNDAIEIARKGVYNQNIVSDVSPERIGRFFSKEGTVFRINNAIREMVVFAPHNVIKDPPFTKLELLLCRNLLIYLEPELQKKLMSLFHYSLNAGGVMMLGNAENENSKRMLFTTLDANHKLYKRTVGSIEKEILDFPYSFSHTWKKQTEITEPVMIIENIQTLADQLVLQHFAPASVLITLNGDILYITGHTGKYLEPAAGKANMNIYAMARDGLRDKLPGAVRKAKMNAEPVKLYNIKIGINDRTQIVDVTLQLIEKPDTIKGTILLVFSDVASPAKTAGKRLKKQEPGATDREQELELELQRANEELQSTHEEMQTTLEELKSTNEELQSTNEELQSTNEELTTSKEEMQSLNEELQTINAELQSKINDLMSANSDMKNLLNSTDIATLFLDRDLNIRRYTDQVTTIFKLRSIDIGRPFTDVVSDLQYPEMKIHAMEVLKTLTFKETDIETPDKRWYTVRIMPYRTLNDRIDGLVITMVDNTKCRNLEIELNRVIKDPEKQNVR